MDVRKYLYLIVYGMSNRFYMKCYSYVPLYLMIRNSDVLPDSDTNSSSTGLTSDEKLVDIRPSQIYMFSFKEA